MNNLTKTAKPSVSARRANKPRAGIVTSVERDPRDRQGMQSTPNGERDRSPLHEEANLPAGLHSLDVHYRAGQDVPQPQPRGRLKLSSYLVSPDNHRAIKAGARALSSAPVAYGSSRVGTLRNGTKLLFLENPHTPESRDVGEYAENHGQNRHAVFLTTHDSAQQGAEKKLQRISVRSNKVVKYEVKDGLYPFILDQNNQLSVSNVTAGTTGITGAHYLLSMGLPVLFAGELVIAKGKIVHFTNASGQYMTPSDPTWVDQARKNPLLKHVPFVPYTPSQLVGSEALPAVATLVEAVAKQLVEDKSSPEQQVLTTNVAAVLPAVK